MRYDDELKREVPSTLGELRSYFDDADPAVLGGAEAKTNIMQVIDVLIDAAPGKRNAMPSADHTTMVRMILSKAKEMAVAVALEPSDLEVLVEAAKRTNNRAKMMEVANRIESASKAKDIDLMRAAQARAMAQSLRLFANKVKM